METTYQISYNGKIFNVNWSDELRDVLLNDPQKLNDYCKSHFSHQIEKNHFPASIDSKWSKSLTKLLIDTRLQREEAFNRPLCKKKKLWALIAEEIKNQSKINVTGDMCDSKFRNLINTYRANKKKQKSSGEGSITWEYYEQFDSVLGCKAANSPPPRTLSDSTEAESGDSTELEQITHSPSTSQQSINNAPKPHKPKKLSLGEYLFQKNIREEKLYAEKLELKRKIWEEKKALREQEINAILELAKCMSSKSCTEEI